ncbi:hypothetical protein CEXT_332971 [Caerostris extrusa]|uniref:Uncharacterized protein n=1 Tax=Caerostris extrusa TaxID=172846 RepID=A0AAV4RNN1_CAEEX|nr:hypothetical protein CEXT_332971 [Caerostris extrusa]
MTYLNRVQIKTFKFGSKRMQSPQSSKYVSSVCVAAFPQHQSLGSVKDSTEDSTVSKWKRPIATVNTGKTVVSPPVEEREIRKLPFGSLFTYACLSI